MSDMPELRPGPPWAMEEMILAEPGLVAPILGLAGGARGGGVDPRGRAGGDHRLRHERARGDGRRGAARRRASRATRSRRASTRRPAASDRGLARGRHRGDARRDAAPHNGARTILITAKPERRAGADIVVAHAAAWTRRGATPSATSRRCSRSPRSPAPPTRRPARA